MGKKKKQAKSYRVSMDATSLLMHTFPWLVISFVVNLVAYSPLYFLFPATDRLVRSVVNPKEAINNWLYPLVDRVGPTRFVVGLAKGADFILTMFWVIIVLAITGLFIKWMASYFTYVMKAGHIANLTVLMMGKRPRNQFLFGFKQMLGRFGSFNLMFVADKLTRDAVRKVNKKMFMSEGTPEFINRFKILRKNLPKFTEMLLTNVDETILSYVMINEGNVWSLYASAIASYVKAWKEVVKAALSTIVTLWVIEGLLKILVYGMFFVAMKEKGLQTLILSLAFARYVMYVIKITFIDSYKYTKILLAFYKHSSEVSKDDPMYKQLRGIASFRTIMNRAEREKTVDKVADAVSENLDMSEDDFGVMGTLIKDNLLPEKGEEGKTSFKDMASGVAGSVPIVGKKFKKKSKKKKKSQKKE